MAAKSVPDFVVRSDVPNPTVYLLVPMTDAARDWVASSISDDALCLGRSVAVEHRFIADIVAGIQADGLTVTSL